MKPLKNWTVGVQLGIGFGSIVAMVLLVSFASWRNVSAIDTQFSRVVVDTLPRLTALSEVNNRLHILRTAELSHLAALTMPAKDQQEKLVKEAGMHLNKAFAEYKEKTKDESPSASEGLKKYIDAYILSGQTFLQMSNSAAGAESERAVEASEYFSGPSNSAYQTAYKTEQLLWQGHIAEANQLKESGRTAVSHANILMLVVALFSVVLSVVIASTITRSLMNQLGGQPSYVAFLANRIADADLATQIKLRHQDNSSVIAAMARMQGSLRTIVNSVRNSANGVALASIEIEQGNHDLSNRTEHQASTLQETVANMNDLNYRVGQNALAAEKASQLAVSASGVAVMGGEVVSMVVDTMKGINEASQRIADIISVIDGIAFQTNILALNAAVEAARAGEQGRGFAVVASEVRLLAGRSANAAKEIKSLINASVERIVQGNKLVDRAGRTMQDVVTSIQSVSSLVAEISASSSEQSNNSSKVEEAISEMERVTQQNAALVEQMAAAASSLKSQANDLVRVVEVFRSNENMTLSFEG